MLTKKELKLLILDLQEDYDYLKGKVDRLEKKVKALTPAKEKADGKKVSK